MENSSNDDEGSNHAHNPIEIRPLGECFTSGNKGTI